MSNKLGRVLCAVPHDWQMIGPVLERMQQQQPQPFKTIVQGNTLDAFAPLRDTTDPLVLLIGGAGTHDITKELTTWKTAAGTPRVEWVHSYWTGVDAFNFKPIASNFDGIPLTNARGVFAPMLAEHVVLSALYFNRQVWKLQALRKAKTWDRFPSLPGDRQTMGIVGYGNIGRAVAKQAMGAMGVKCIGHKTRALPGGKDVDDQGVRVVTGEDGLQQLFQESDFVVAVLPNVPEAYHLFNRDRFRQMKDTAVFINIGRGASIVEDDLVEAVLAKDIKGAAIDVFEVEPLPATSRLWELDDSQLLLSSHNADISPHSYTDAVEDFVQHAEVFAATGALPEYRVDILRGY